jgi:DNA-binding MarR family transcriptional regulator
MGANNNLLLENQLCFPVYATSRLITRLYKPFLDKIDLTYPQYLVMLVLWEQDGRNVSDIGRVLCLNTNTLTPLIKKMEAKNLISKVKSDTDVRAVNVCLTNEGMALEEQGAHIPAELANATNLPVNEIEALRTQMWDLLKKLQISE